MSGPIKLPPWTRGPQELLKHADGHLKGGRDTDRRLALIGFDQTIEVCIDVFLRLHPRLRAGIEISREEADRAGRNFHSKIEFLERRLQPDTEREPIAFEAIVWYHSLRNEIYHSGNGMVPELHVLEGAREAALQVFGAVFGPKYVPLLLDEAIQRRDPVEATTPGTHDRTMDFLKAYMELEGELRQVAGDVPSHSSTIPDLWREIGHLPQAAKWSDQLMLLLRVRNAVVHGEDRASLGAHEIAEATAFALEAAEWIRRELLAPLYAQRLATLRAEDER